MAPMGAILWPVCLQIAQRALRDRVAIKLDEKLVRDPSSDPRVAPWFCWGRGFVVRKNEDNEIIARLCWSINADHLDQRWNGDTAQLLKCFPSVTWIC